LECGGKRSATPLWIDPTIQSAVAARQVGTLPAHCYVNV